MQPPREMIQELVFKLIICSPVISNVDSHSNIAIYVYYILPYHLLVNI